jgi:hypothetical protein
MIRIAAAALVALAPSAWAQEPEQEALFDALQIDRTVALMRAESVERSEELERDLFPERRGPAWREAVERIYDEEAMLGRMREGVSGALEGQDVGAMTDFFASDRGRLIVSSELAARETLSDEDAEEAARAAWALMPEEDPERARLIEAFVSANDLVEQNVEAALNANLGFLQGLQEGGAFPEPMSEADMLAQVWSSEGEVRAETVDWLGAHLALAYEPLSDADLGAYVAFSESEGGQALNRALFAGFDAMYEGVGVELGRAAAERMTSLDL